MYKMQRGVANTVMIGTAVLHEEENTQYVKYGETGRLFTREREEEAGQKRMFRSEMISRPTREAGDRCSGASR